MRRSQTSYPSGTKPPIHIPLRLEAAILSRIRSPVTSRSNWAKDSRTLSVKRPIEVVVLNCWVTATKETPCASNTSTILAKSASERVNRSTFVDHHHINQALIDVTKHTLQCWAFHRSTRQTAVVVRGLDQTPSFASLALDERFARLALCLQRVEVLFQSFLRRLAGVDCAAAARSFSGFHDFAPWRRI